MPVTIDIAFIGWGLVALGLFYFAPPRQAVLTSFIGGSLFLPNAGYSLPLLHSKVTIVALGVLLCSVLFHSKLWAHLRLRLVDVPILVWCCLCPFASAMDNNTGTYDALSAVAHGLLIWGVPYFIGRLYFASIAGLRDLAVGLLVGGLVYVPFCLWEIRMSPQLHATWYGSFQHQFAQHMRFGGFRPAVFMQHGLAVALWMTAASVQGVWLWRTGALRHLWGIPMAWIMPVLLVTTLLCKSVSAVVLLLLGCAVYFLNKSSRSAIFVLCLVTVAPLYMVLRATGQWSGNTAVALTRQVINEERAGSLQFRINNENILIEKALQRKSFGWARWGRSRVYDPGRRDISITDGLWVMTLGENGLVGLIALSASMLLPVIILLRRCPARYWTHRDISPAAALAVLLALYMIDNLVNDMGTPVFVLAAGGLMGLRKRAVVLALKPNLFPSQQTGLQPIPRLLPMNR